ncbi:MAG: hypothetical protein PQJ59_12540 [Spirochaetales bacterium]|nr:hypothetical protein [Spirochaetales bacterium]
MKRAIVFFSRDGSTRIAAEILGEKLEGTLIELIPRKKRGFIRSAYGAIKKKNIPLEGAPEQEIVSYDQILLGTPVWASNGTPAINTFLERADFSGKEVSIFTVQADPEREGSREIHDYLAAKIREKGGKEPIKRYAFHGARPGKTSPRSHLEEQINRMIFT